MENVESLLYADETNTLRVTYKSGSQWEYHPINSEVYASIIASSCLAKAVHQAIRSGIVVGTLKVD